MPDHDQTARDREALDSFEQAIKSDESRAVVWLGISMESANRLLTLGRQALELREENARLTGELQTLENDHRALAEQCDEAEDQLKNAREENARLAQELGGAGSGILPAPQWQTHLEEENATLRQENARLEAEVERLKTYYEQCLGLAQAAKYACFTAKTSAPTLAVTGNQLMDAVEHLVQENARLDRELEQAREDAEVGRLLREMPSNWRFYWRGGRWHINIKVSTGLVPFNGYDTESLVNEARKILDKDSYWSEIVETRDANPGGEEDAR